MKFANVLESIVSADERRDFVAARVIREWSALHASSSSPL